MIDIRLSLINYEAMILMHSVPCLLLGCVAALGFGSSLQGPNTLKERRHTEEKPRGEIFRR